MSAGNPEDQAQMISESTTEPPAVTSFEEIRTQELEALKRLASGLGQADLDNNLMGLAFSGGGIRSATFNLGVLQALSERKLLGRFDYLSTVSGGGYIGSWLSAWIWRERDRMRVERWEREWQEVLASRKRAESPAPQPGAAAENRPIARWISDWKERKRVEDEKMQWQRRKDPEEERQFASLDARNAVEAVQDVLGKSADACARETVADAPRNIGGQKEPDQITFLRAFSNYLTPKLGLLSYDTLAAVATYLRNFLLNQTILVLALASVLILPRALARLGDRIVSSAQASLWVAVFLLAVALVFMNLNLIDQLRKRDDGQRWYVMPSAVFFLITVPLVMAATIIGFLATVSADLYAIGGRWTLYWGIVILCVAAWSIAVIISWIEEGAIVSPGTFLQVLWNSIGLLTSAAVAVGLLILLQKIFEGGYAGRQCAVVVWGMPASLVLFTLMIAAQVGVTGRPLNEGSREWWGRIGGALLGVAVTWIAVSACALYAPYWVIWLQNWADALGIAWVASTVAGVVTAASAFTGKPGSKKVLEIVPRLAPYVFVAGLLVALSYALFLGLAYLKWGTDSYALAAGASTWEAYGGVLDESTGSLAACLGLCVCAAAGALILSWRVDVNVFSLHRFYLNRLERCYLGASNPRRRDNPFTGFDPKDSVRLDALVQRPYPIINTAINLTRTRRLAWQERKAASFMFTPLYCGYELRGGEEAVFAYQPTAEYAKDAKDWVGLAKAFAVSGAAVSPNMGYHSAPAVAFLLTIFNLRLGLWMENPGKANLWKRSYCLIGLWYLLCELFGATDEKKNFVYLSDGGHFENLGIYELVRRRCRFIVASDASMDGSCTFDDLGNAARKCSVDLGVPIEIDTLAIVPDAKTRLSQFHCTVGIIHYEHATPGERPGYLLYLKPSLTGNEPVDVKQYAASHAEYPHEPTADQWFAESQFESYRRLGYKVARTVFEAAGSTGPFFDKKALFVSLREQWYPPSTSTKAAFSKHGDQLKILHNTLRQDRNLEFLDAQIFPEWPTLMQDAWPPHKTEYGLPAYQEERRAGFYFCANLLQLMENVYIDLNLQDEYDHPENRGWMNLFRHWSWSGMFRVTYASIFSTYGARFQQFCRNRLDLTEGEIKIEAKLDLLPFLESAERSLELNFLEIELVRKFAGKIEFDRIIPFRLCVSNQNVPGKKEQREIQYEFGFALALGTKLVYFRIQDHLRKSGLARKAFHELYAAGYTWPAVKDGEKTPYDTYLASLTPEELRDFKRRYGDEPDVIQRLRR
ncbi:MAG TPA: patatin-like phospholipase family protein [Syntrophales bacterium]|nr:patatin-like phospholipase family protein [Syntrophales bacterium]